MLVPDAVERLLAEHCDRLEILVSERTAELATASQPLASGVEGLTTAEDELRRRVVELCALYRIAKISETATDRGAAVRSVLELVAGLVGADCAAVVAAQPDGTVGSYTWLASPRRRLPRWLGKRLVEAREDAASATGSRPAPDATRIERVGSSCLVVAPLVRAGDQRGDLYLVIPERDGVSDGTRRLVEQVASALADQLEHFHLVARLQDTAATDERSRIARDLHDSLSQTLYSIAMVAEALPRAVRRDVDAAAQDAAHIRAMTLRALADIRTLLLELRPDELEAASLSRLVQQLADSGGGTARLPVSVFVTGSADVPSDVKVACHRITQEALTNAQRHSGAKGLQVHLGLHPQTVSLDVVDDGKGFDPAGVAPGSHHGLRIMRERAAAVGAALVVESTPGRGTAIRLAWTRPRDDSSSPTSSGTGTHG